MRHAGVLTFLICGLVAAGASCAPTINVDSAIYTATVQPGAEVIHVFRLTNTGDETLSIAKVLAACGCTATSLDRTVLSPGESVELEAKVDTTGFQGTVDKRVTVQSNDPATPNLNLHLVLTIAGTAQPEAALPASAQPQGASPTPAPSVAGEPSAGRAAGWFIAVVGAAAVGFGLGVSVLWLRRRKRRKG